MSTRLEKLQKIRVPVSSARREGGNPPQMNQTIIINNPNININYHGEVGWTNGALSSRGLDNWHLNNNLKEFGQTRQLGFFKPKKDRNKSSSPYIIHKVRTQDIRSINKVYAPTHLQMKDAQAHTRINETISHLQPPPNDPPLSTLERINSKRDKTVTDKFYQGQIRKNMRLDLPKNLETLPTSHLANPENHLPEPQSQRNPKSFRRGRFQLPEKTITPISFPREPSSSSSEQVSSPEKCLRGQKCDKQSDSADSSTKDRTTASMVPVSLRKRVFTRTIASIDKILLSNADEYFQRSYGEKLPQSQIELCVNSLSHPEQAAPSRERSSQRQFNTGRQYDFQFEEERKRRPKTPRRKKFYDQQE